MKKVILTLLALLAGFELVYASCVGPYCFDEKGAQVSTGLTIYSTDKTTISALAPATIGQMLVCNNCTVGGSSNSAGFDLCIASGTGTGAYVEVSSRSLVCK